MAAPITETAYLASQASAYQQAIYQAASGSVIAGGTNPVIVTSADAKSHQSQEWVDQYLSRIGRDPGRANGPYS